MPTDEKVRIALELERATQGRRPAHPQRRVGELRRRARRGGARELARRRSRDTRRTTCSASAVALADDGSGTQTGYGFVAGRTLSDLDLDIDPARRGDARVPAARRQARSPGRRIPVILDPLVTRSVLGVLSSAFNGESMLKGRSLFAGRVGEQIGAPIVQLIDDPTDVRALGRVEYDGEGVPDPAQRA